MHVDDKNLKLTQKQTTVNFQFLQQTCHSSQTKPKKSADNLTSTVKKNYLKPAAQPVLLVP